MTSQINPTNINGAYPVAGQDNNSQGFRTNFTNTVNNFTYAADEITDLQNNAVLKSALSGTTLDNDMLGAPLSNALLSDMAYASVSLGSLSNTVTLDYSVASFYSVTTGNDITLAFTNWPATGQTGVMTVTITVTNINYTVQLPLAVSLNVAGVRGATFVTGVGYNIAFAVPGVYTFTFTTVNNGTTIALTENNKQLQPFNASAEVYASGPASLAVTTTLFPGGITNQPTLANGVEGQIKVFVQTSSTPATITVTNAGWTGAGDVELNNQGESATLQFVGGKWYGIGSNNANFI